MGQINVTVLNPQKYDGRQYLSQEKFTPWPTHKKAAPGQLVTFFVAIPPGNESQMKTVHLTVFLHVFNINGHGTEPLYHAHTN